MSANHKRRALLLGAAALALGARVSRAQAWPSRPIRIIVPFPPGGLTDLYGRALADHLQTALGR